MSFQSHKIIKKSRKLHRCWHCTLAIPKSTLYEIDSGVFDNEFYSYKQHAECRMEYGRINEDHDHDEWSSLDYCEETATYFKDWKDYIKKIYQLEMSS